MILEYIGGPSKAEQVASIEEAVAKVEAIALLPERQQPADVCLQDDEGHCICAQEDFFNKVKPFGF